MSCSQRGVKVPKFFCKVCRHVICEKCKAACHGRHAVKSLGNKKTACACRICGVATIAVPQMCPSHANSGGLQVAGPAYTCKTCQFQEGQVICGVCVMYCHSGHQVFHAQAQTYSCVCGLLGCPNRTAQQAAPPARLTHASSAPNMTLPQQTHVASVPMKHVVKGGKLGSKKAAKRGIILGPANTNSHVQYATMSAQSAQQATVGAQYATVGAQTMGTQMMSQLQDRRASAPSVVTSSPPPKSSPPALKPRNATSNLPIKRHSSSLASTSNNNYMSVPAQRMVHSAEPVRVTAPDAQQTSAPPVTNSLYDEAPPDSQKQPSASDGVYGKLTLIPRPSDEFYGPAPPALQQIYDSAPLPKNDNSIYTAAPAPQNCDADTIVTESTREVSTREVSTSEVEEPGKY